MDNVYIKFNPKEGLSFVVGDKEFTHDTFLMCSDGKTFRGKLSSDETKELIKLLVNNI